MHIVRAPGAPPAPAGAEPARRTARNVRVRVGGTVLPNLDEASDWPPAAAQDAGYALGQILQLVRMLSAYTGVPMLCEPCFQSSTSYVSEVRREGAGARRGAVDRPAWLALHIPQAVINHREYAPSAAIDSIATSVQGVFSSSLGSSPAPGGAQADAAGSVLKSTPRGQNALREFRRAVLLLKRASSALCGAQFTRMGYANPVGLDPLAQLAIVSSLLSRPAPAGEGAGSARGHGGSRVLSSSCFGLGGGPAPAEPPSPRSAAPVGAHPQGQLEHTMSSSSIAALVQRFVSDGDLYESDDGGAEEEFGLDDDDETDGWEAIEKPLAPRPSDLPEDIVNWEREVLAPSGHARERDAGRR